MLHRVLAGDELPHRLADLSPPPASLHLWGELPPPPYVAIVGSRRASDRAQMFVRRLAATLARGGVTVISGGAEGIDTAAHRGALDVGAPTLVVAPCGFERPYPSSNGRLFKRIVVRGGGYLSLEPAEAGATRPSFFRRNAVLAALCHALVLGEANLRSGARNAVKHARALGRAVFSVPSAAWNLRGRGSNLELRAGARWLEEADDVLRFLEESGQLVRRRAVASEGAAAPSGALVTRRRRACASEKESAPPAGVSGSWHLASSRMLEAVANAVQAGARNEDALCEATGLTAAEVSVALLELSLAGVVGLDANGLLRWRGAPSSSGP